MITDQLWFELILAVSVTQPSITTLAPSEELPAGSDAGAVGPSSCNIHNFHSTQGLDYTGSVTGAKVTGSHSINTL